MHLFRYEPPVSAATIARWQGELDDAVGVADRLSRLAIVFEPGDAWQPVQRFLIWQLEPLAGIEPWIRDELLAGKHPRGSGHYCGTGVDAAGRFYCVCPVKRNRWVGGATRFVDRMTYEVYRATGLYGRRWWVLQGATGGHRYAWEASEPAAVASKMRGYPTQTPAPGDLPYAPFDRRTIPLILRERRARHHMAALASVDQRRDALKLEEREAAERTARDLWDWAGDEAERLWYDQGAELLPRYLEDVYGRVPTGTKPRLNPEAVEAHCLTPALD